MGRRLLVCGVPASGKTYCLSGLQDHEKVLFLNCESAKGMDLPFRNKFKKKLITEPLGQIIGDNSYFKALLAKPEAFETVVVDSLTFLMDMFETKYVNTSSNTMQAWGAYADFFKTLMQQETALVPQNVIFTAHTSDVFNDKESVMETKVKIKGSVMNIGVEAFFNNIVYAKKVPLRTLENYQNDNLHITETDEMLGYKHVLQTRLTRDTINEKIRSNDDMWNVNETYIDGNVQLVLNRLNEYYGD